MGSDKYRQLKEQAIPVVTSNIKSHSRTTCNIWLFETLEQDCLWKRLHYPNTSSNDVFEITRQNSNPCRSRVRGYWPGGGGCFGHVDERRSLHEEQVCREIQRR